MTHIADAANKIDALIARMKVISSEKPTPALLRQMEDVVVELQILSTTLAERLLAPTVASLLLSDGKKGTSDALEFLQKFTESTLRMAHAGATAVHSGTSGGCTCGKCA